jgi:hypothetical protein
MNNLKRSPIVNIVFAQTALLASSHFKHILPFLWRAILTSDWSRLSKDDMSVCEKVYVLLLSFFLWERLEAYVMKKLWRLGWNRKSASEEK